MGTVPGGTGGNEADGAPLLGNEACMHEGRCPEGVGRPALLAQSWPSQPAGSLAL